MFRGIAQLNLDSKGRLAVPARHRDLLLERCAGHLVITADADRCLLVYPLPEVPGRPLRLGRQRHAPEPGDRRNALTI